MDPEDVNPAPAEALGEVKEKAQEEWQGEYDPLSDPEEEKTILSALSSFANYRRAAHYNVTHLRRQSFYALPSQHWMLLAGSPFNILSHLDAVDAAIDANADLAEAIYEAGLPNFFPTTTTTAAPTLPPPTPSSLDKARSTLRQLYRDWSAEGAAERDACYTPILRTLSTHFPGSKPRHSISILVPGAGLGRLVLELAGAGYTVEGNEISYHQLLASSYLLNHIRAAGQHVLHPWALGFSNHRARADQLAGVRVPDVHPGTWLAERSVARGDGAAVPAAWERMSMTASDFCVLYRGEGYRGAFDVVATVFFVDTAPNVVRYVETIGNCLKEGGLWINLGPLLWHFDNNSAPGHGGGAEQEEEGQGKGAGRMEDRGIGEPGSVELTDEEVRALVEAMGFKVESWEQDTIETGYIQDPRSMLQNVYRPSFWVARKL